MQYLKHDSRELQQRGNEVISGFISIRVKLRFSFLYHSFIFCHVLELVQKPSPFQYERVNFID